MRLRRCNGAYSAADFIKREVAAWDDKLVGNPQDVIAASPQVAVARGVVQFLLDALVWRAVEFDDQTMLDAQKIDNEASDRNLPSKFQTIEASAAQVARRANAVCRAPTRAGIVYGRMSALFLQAP